MSLFEFSTTRNGDSGSNFSLLANIDCETLNASNLMKYTKNVENISNDEEVVTVKYVSNQINNLINGAPEALNTLKELSNALGSDQNFVTTITNKFDLISLDISSLQS